MALSHCKNVHQWDRWVKPSDHPPSELGRQQELLQSFIVTTSSSFSLPSLCVHVSDRHSSVKSWASPWHTLAPVPSSPTLSEGLEGQWGLAWLQCEEALALQGQEVLLLELLHLQELLLESQLLGSHLLLLQERDQREEHEMADTCCCWSEREGKREWDPCPGNVRCGRLKPLHHPTLIAGSPKPLLSSNTDSGTSETTSSNTDSGMSETIPSSNVWNHCRRPTLTVVTRVEWRLSVKTCVKRPEHLSSEARWWVEASLPAVITQEKNSSITLALPTVKLERREFGSQYVNYSTLKSLLRHTRKKTATTQCTEIWTLDL